MLKRFTGPAVSFLAALGFQVSGFESLPLAIGLWSVAALWGGGAIAIQLRDGSQPVLTKVEDRDVLNVTPRYLRRLYRGRSSVQADRLAEPYIGKWIQVTRRIHDVHDGWADQTWVWIRARWWFVIVGGNDMSLDVSFAPRDRERLSLMKRGQKITFIGRIERISRHSVGLKDCELVR